MVRDSTYPVWSESPHNHGIPSTKGPGASTFQQNYRCPSCHYVSEPQCGRDIFVQANTCPHNIQKELHDENISIYSDGFIPSLSTNYNRSKDGPAEWRQRRRTAECTFPPTVTWDVHNAVQHRQAKKLRSTTVQTTSWLSFVRKNKLAFEQLVYIGHPPLSTSATDRMAVKAHFLLL